MPWSDWQPAEEVQRQAFSPWHGYVTAAREYTKQDVPPYPTATEIMQPLVDAAQEWVGGTTQWTRARKTSNAASSFGQALGNTFVEGEVRHDASMAFFDALAFFPTRNDFPNTLGDLEYGVDYVEIPGTNDYIEYQDGSFQRQPSEFLRWQGTVQINVLDAHDDDSPQNLDATVTIQFTNSPPTDPDFPEDTAFAPPLKFHADPLSPNMLLDFRGGPLSGVMSDSTSFATTEATFQLVVETQLSSILIDYVGAQSYSSEMTFPYAGAFFTQPPWRYWIPDTTKPIPLRQRQRDDGLALASAARWRGSSSRQATNRWRAYT